MAESMCESCENYDWDEDSETYVCTKDLDEDEMYRFMTGTNYNCPYYSSDDEYAIARKQ